jgi:hypothetical protein
MKCQHFCSEQDSRRLASCNHDLRTTTFAQANQELTNQGAMGSIIEAGEGFSFCQRGEQLARISFTHSQVPLSAGGFSILEVPEGHSDGNFCHLLPRTGLKYIDHADVSFNPLLLVQQNSANSCSPMVSKMLFKPTSTSLLKSVQMLQPRQHNLFTRLFNLSSQKHFIQNSVNLSQTPQVSNYPSFPHPCSLLPFFLPCKS